jgi:hypothetical protein
VSEPGYRLHVPPVLLVGTFRAFIIGRDTGEQLRMPSGHSGEVASVA